MSKPVFTSGYLDGSGKSAHGAKADHTHDAANQAASTAADVAGLKNDFNALLVKLKNAGLMTGDAFSLTLTGDVNDSFAGHADRQYNTGKISGVELADGEIVITLKRSPPSGTLTAAAPGARTSGSASASMPASGRTLRS